MSRTYLEQVQEAVEKMHGLKTKYLKTVPVIEMFKGKVAWEGEVEVFQVKKHPKIKRCYAWGYDAGGKLEIVAVLGLPPIDSPETAVKAVIASQAGK
jgi:hypothetical protein